MVKQNVENKYVSLCECLLVCVFVSVNVCVRSYQSNSGARSNCGKGTPGGDVACDKRKVANGCCLPQAKSQHQAHAHTHTHTLTYTLRGRRRRAKKEMLQIGNFIAKSQSQ